MYKCSGVSSVSSQLTYASIHLLARAQVEDKLMGFIYRLAIGIQLSDRRTAAQLVLHDCWGAECQPQGVRRKVMTSTDLLSLSF